MRRGRPTKPERSPGSPVVENHTPSKTFDPFDPTHVNKSASPPPPSSQTATPPASFQNSFIPEPSSSTSFKKTPTASTSTSFKNTTSSSSSSFKNTSATSSSPAPSRVQSAPLTHHMTPKPQMATKILQTQPNSPVTAEDQPEKKVEDQEKSEEDDDQDMPKMNRGVSSSIEARFMAIKNASRNNSSHPVKPTPSVSSSKKNKPTPPPKPARFRSQQVPSVDDFEHKFPSLEELDKSIT
jgi:hypothetical protein